MSDKNLLLIATLAASIAAWLAWVQYKENKDTIIPYLKNIEFNTVSG